MHVTGALVDPHDAARHEYLGAEAVRLLRGAARQLVAGDPGGKAEVVLEPRRGPGLAAGRLALDDDRPQAFAGPVHRGREAGGPADLLGDIGSDGRDGVMVVRLDSHDPRRPVGATADRKRRAEDDRHLAEELKLRPQCRTPRPQCRAPRAGTRRRSDAARCPPPARLRRPAAG